MYLLILLQRLNFLTAVLSFPTQAKCFREKLDLYSLSLEKRPVPTKRNKHKRNCAGSPIIPLLQKLNISTISVSADDSEKWPPPKQHSTLQYLEKRSRVRKTRDQSSRRAASQDRSFVSLGSWRRKSEPSMALQQYNTKTMPKKISNLKKAKESNATFYTDLSDSESCDIANESNDSIDCGKSEGAAPEEAAEEKGKSEQVAINMNTLERVVSDLLMQNKEFQKILNKRWGLCVNYLEPYNCGVLFLRKNGRGSEPLANIWSQKTEEEKLPAKADSLPRNIQLNDQIENFGSEPREVPAEKVAAPEIEEQDET